MIYFSPSLALKIERAAIFLILLLIFWLPLPKASNQPWSMAALVVFVGCIAFLWGMLISFGNQPVQSKRHSSLGWWLFGLLMLLQVWVAVQGVLGITLDVAQLHLYLLLGVSYSLLFVMTWYLFHTEKRLKLLLAVLIVSGTFQAFYGAVMVLSGVEWLFGIPKESGKGRATGTFVNRNHLAGYLELTLACGIGLLLALRDNSSFQWRNLLELIMGPKARIRLALIIMVIGLVMTQSRMGNAAFMVALLFAGGLFVLRHPQNRVRNGLILISILLIDLLIISQFFGFERLKNRITDTEVTVSVEAGELIFDINDLRGLAMERMVPIVKEHAMTGVGAGSYEMHFIGQKGPGFGGHFDHAHNDYLQFWIELGLIGLLPLGLFVAVVFWQALRALWQPDAPFQNGLGFGVVMALMAYLVHSFSDFNLQIPANAATLMVICAVAVRINSISRRRSKRSLRH